jgi:DNA-binding MarR family transcriptional regulator
MDTAKIAELFSTVSLGAPENAVGFVLWRVFHRYQRAVDRSLAVLDLTNLQFTTLTLVAWLSKSGDTPTQAEIARFGDIHPMQVSLMLKALEQKGMIARAAVEANARAKSVSITAMGLDALQRALPLAIEVQRQMFGEEGRVGGAVLAMLLDAQEKGTTLLRNATTA